MRARLLPRRIALAALACTAVLILLAPLRAAVDPLQPAGSGGVAELSRDLDRLAQHRRLMIIGAHPDDEDDTLLSVASLGDGTEVAYLSLTRGEGGQNVIGDELGESLGVLRSEVLLAGRRLDRGRQLFTRAYDFGYTESMAEGFAKWPREELLVDVVRAIRRFRPQVVVAVFPPDERAGHGQHQVSGAMADDAMRVAGDPAALPQLAAEGLSAWQPEAFFREAWRDPTTATVVLSSQRLDPLTGHTLYQIAMDVRSLHRSQSEGQLQALEGRPVNLRREAPAIEGQDALFAGVDTRLTALAKLQPAGPEADELQRLLADVETVAGEARRGLAPGQLAEAVAPLSRALRDLRDASRIAGLSQGVTSSDSVHLPDFLAEKEAIATDALVAALGLVVDATADRAEVVPGSELQVSARVLDGGAVPLRIESLTLESPAGWTPAVDVALTTPPPQAAAAAASASGGGAGAANPANAGGAASATTDARSTTTGGASTSIAGAASTPGSAPTTESGAAAAAPGGVTGATSDSTATGAPAMGEVGGASTSAGAGIGSSAGAAIDTAAASTAAAAGAAVAPDANASLEPEPAPAPPTVSIEPGAVMPFAAKITVDAAAAPTAPYFLRRPRQGDLYDWTDVPPAIRGEPFEPPPLLLRALLTLDTEAGPLPLTVTREVVAISKSLSRGEVRRPLRAVPAVEVSVAQGMLPWPLADTQPRRLHVTLDAHAAVEGQLSVLVPEGWPAVPLQPFQLPAGEKRTFELPLTPPSPLPAGRTSLEVGAITFDGGRYFQSLPLVDYEHVRPRPIPIPSRVAISAFPLELPKLQAVGYVRGAADHEPEALLAVGVPLQELSPADLLSRDLADFDAIVIGPRAYDAAPELAAANSRLNDFVRAGGLLIVQSQRNDYFAKKLAPLPLDMPRGNATRTTDETAAVRLLQPDHAVFTTPNALDASDWEGWVQERGLYYPQTWDPAYVPLIAMADPGKPELSGALLVAPYGQGTFVYTGLAFFRQLPAGVPGAYRLLANILALAHPRVQSEDLPSEGN